MTSFFLRHLHRLRWTLGLCLAMLMPALESVQAAPAGSGRPSVAGVERKNEYEILRSFPPGRFSALSAKDFPDAKGLTGSNRQNGSWLEAGPQRGSCRALIAAVVAGDLAAADRAWIGIDTAFAHQRPDGSFVAEIRPNGASARPYPASVETTFFFLQELGRALLVIRQSPHEAHFRQRIATIEPKVRLSCAFINAGYDTIVAHTQHAVNRLIIAAKAFGLCGTFLGDNALIEKSRRLIALSLTLRDDAGVFLEKGGRDSSYNVVSILYGQVLALHVPLPEFEAALPAAVAWQVSRIGPDGQVDVRGNTRTGLGQEKSYFGDAKTVNYTEVALALTYYGTVHNDAAALAAADRVVAFMKKGEKEKPSIGKKTAAGVVGTHTAAPVRPNLLIINADDLGIGDVSCYNPQSAWRTPRIDRLAREGLRFTDAHSASSLCTPSRYALLTGRYAWRGRLKQGVLNGYGTSLIEPGRPTLAGFLRDHGYATVAIGKWHLGLDWKKTGPGEEEIDFGQPFGGGPLAHGFQRFFGISASLDMPPYVWLRDDRATALPSGRIGDSKAPRLWRGGPIAPDFQMEDVQPCLIDEALDTLSARARAGGDQPFFLYLALASPHTPVLPTKAFAGKTGVTSYGDFVTQVDADVGRLLDALERHQLDRNTLVIFTSDNGFAPAVSVPEHRRHGHDPSAGYRGYKSDLYEGGHRIPFIARWPGQVPAGERTSALIGQLDLFATCADLLGVPLPANAAEDSVSFLPQLRGASGSAGRETLVNHSAEGRFALREGRWKLLLWPGSGGWSSPTPSPSRWLEVEATDLSSLPPYQLYDLDADPAEATNLADRHPDIVQRLGRKLRASIENGRSTPGPRGAWGPTAAWPQLGWMKDFPDAN